MDINTPEPPASPAYTTPTPTPTPTPPPSPSPSPSPSTTTTTTSTTTTAPTTPGPASELTSLLFLAAARSHGHDQGNLRGSFGVQAFYRGFIVGVGVTIRGTLGDIGTLNKVSVQGARSKVKKGPFKALTNTT